MRKFATQMFSAIHESEADLLLNTIIFVLGGDGRCKARCGVCALSGAVRLPKRVARRRKNGPNSDSARRALIFHCPVGDDTRASLFPLPASAL